MPREKGGVSILELARRANVTSTKRQQSKDSTSVKVQDSYRGSGQRWKSWKISEERTGESGWWREAGSCYCAFMRPENGKPHHLSLSGHLLLMCLVGQMLVDSLWRVSGWVGWMCSTPSPSSSPGPPLFFSFSSHAEQFPPCAAV